MKIKICGIRRVTDIEIVNKYLPDYIGYIFYKNSFRYISFKKAKVLSSKLNENIIPVGVFVNENPVHIIKLFQDGIIKIAQLHGDEDEEYIKKLKELSKERTGEEIKIIKAIIIKDNTEITEYPSADYYLFDSGKGSGETFNWDKIKNTKIQKPIFLAGGINKENLKEAINKVKPFAIDLSSSVETNKFKDEEKIKEIIKTIKEF